MTVDHLGQHGDYWIGYPNTNVRGTKCDGLVIINAGDYLVLYNKLLGLTKSPDQ